MDDDDISPPLTPLDSQSSSPPLNQLDSPGMSSGACPALETFNDLQTIAATESQVCFNMSTTSDSATTLSTAVSSNLPKPLPEISEVDGISSCVLPLSQDMQRDPPRSRSPRAFRKTAAIMPPPSLDIGEDMDLPPSLDSGEDMDLLSYTDYLAMWFAIDDEGDSHSCPSILQGILDSNLRKCCRLPGVILCESFQALAAPYHIRSRCDVITKLVCVPFTRLIVEKLAGSTLLAPDILFSGFPYREPFRKNQTSGAVLKFVKASFDSSLSSYEKLLDGCTEARPLLIMRKLFATIVFKTGVCRNPHARQRMYFGPRRGAFNRMYLLWYTDDDGLLLMLEAAIIALCAAQGISGMQNKIGTGGEHPPWDKGPKYIYVVVGNTLQLVV
jgi:hypothetical protein